MTSERMGIGSPLERELQYYRRECNDLGARVLRLQEEQSQAFLEARRSQTVVRLVREAYRLAEPSQATQDVGGALLQVIVENAMCDRAALLREEPPGSGRFLVAHAIGGTTVEADEALAIPSPPRFFFTSSLRLDRPPAGLLDVLRLPFLLWAYDQSSGHALAIGNRSEGNVSRPFESGDQELIEAALSVYLDVLYRKHAEAQLRQAKQAAEEASLSQARFLDALSQELRPPIDRIATFLQAMAPGSAGAEPTQAKAAAQLLAESSHELLALADAALRHAQPWQQSPLLDVQWIDLGDAMRRVHRASYAASVKNEVDLSIALPRRMVSVCVDRDSLHQALTTIVSASLSRASSGSTVKLAAARRGDGAVEIIVSSSDEDAPVPARGDVSPQQEPGQSALFLLGPATDRHAAARRIIEAHDGIFVTEPRPSGGRQVRVMLPAHMARDEATYL